MTDDRLVGVLERIAAALETIAGSERSFASADHASLTAALQDFFGAGPFTAGGILLACDESPGLADAVADVIDMNATPHGRTVQLGRLLRRLPGLVEVGGRRGAVMYRVR